MESTRGSSGSRHRRDVADDSVLIVDVLSIKAGSRSVWRL